MNNVDTCIYSSESFWLDVGANTITWDGRDFSGTIVEDNVYTYYLWAYDAVSKKQPVSRHVDFNRGGGTFLTHDETGKPLTQPCFITTPTTYHTDAEPTYITRQKWIIGNDPDNETLLETTTYPGWIDRGIIAIDPYDHSNFFVSMYEPAYYQLIRKYRWIPNGEAEIQTGWGYDGEVRSYTTVPSSEMLDSGVVYAGNDMLITINQIDNGRPVSVERVAAGNNDRSELVLTDVQNGNEIRRINLSEWWIDQDDADAGVLLVGGPTTMESRNGVLALGSHASCILQLINPHQINEDEMVLYVNSNGDYKGDKNFENDSSTPWVCNDNDTSPYTYNLGIDAHNFLTVPAYDLGAVSFCLFGPDGTGLGYFPYAGETSGEKYGTKIVDYGSAYDGLYTDNRSSDYGGDYSREGLWYIAHDSIKGIIENSIIPAKTQHFANDHNEHNNKATVIIRQTPIINGRQITRHDEFAVFSSHGTCLASKKWGDKEQHFITVYGDNPTTADIDGMQEDETLSFRLWDCETDTEYDALAVYTSSDSTFHNGAVIEVSMLFVEGIEQDKGTPLPSTFSLSQNYPNPFNPVTTISFSLPQESRVTLKIYNTLGGEIDTVSDAFYTAGTHTINWNAGGFSSGLYFYRLEAGEFVETKKLMVLK